MSRVTVVPADRLVIVDGQALTFAFNAPERMHALQWDGKQGHIEWLGSGDEPPQNEPLAADSYAGQVAPYVTLWKEEKARLERAAAEAEAARLAEYNSEAARFERLRAERDRRLTATDYLLMPDYPLDDTLKENVQAYRKALRDLPSQEGAPWDGGGEKTPWPEIHSVLQEQQGSSTSSVYRPLSVDPETGDEPDGSQEHPFAFLYGMDMYSGKYYSYNNHLYLAKSDMMACVWPPDTEGLWQWELVS